MNENFLILQYFLFQCKESHGMFVRQNSCIPLEDGLDDSIPVQATVSSPVPESPAPSATEDKLKIKSR